MCIHGRFFCLISRKSLLPPFVALWSVIGVEFLALGSNVNAPVVVDAVLLYRSTCAYRLGDLLVSVLSSLITRLGLVIRLSVLV